MKTDAQKLEEIRKIIADMDTKSNELKDNPLYIIGRIEAIVETEEKKNSDEKSKL